jgi:hypothetical protein
VVKTILAVILSPLSAFLLSLWIYWYTSAKVFWFFTEVTSAEQANFVYIVGTPGNEEICRIKNETGRVKPLLQEPISKDLSHLKNSEYRVSKFQTVDYFFRPLIIDTLSSNGGTLKECLRL